MTNAQITYTSAQQLHNIANNAQDILITATTVFPFVLFPDTITVDRVKVTIKQRLFFGIAKVMSIQIEDILNAEVSTGPLLGSIKLWSRFFADTPLVVNYLNNKDALAIKRILQGYIIARQKEINCVNVNKHELISLLQELGQEAAV